MDRIHSFNHNTAHKHPKTIFTILYPKCNQELSSIIFTEKTAQVPDLDVLKSILICRYAHEKVYPFLYSPKPFRTLKIRTTSYKMTLHFCRHILEESHVE